MKCYNDEHKMGSILSIPSDVKDPHWGKIIYWCDYCDHTEEKEVNLWLEKYGARQIERVRVDIHKDTITFFHVWAYNEKGNTFSKARTYKATKERVWRVLQASSIYHHYKA